MFYGTEDGEHSAERGASFHHKGTFKHSKWCLKRSNLFASCTGFSEKLLSHLKSIQIHPDTYAHFSFLRLLDGTFLAQCATCSELECSVGHVKVAVLFLTLPRTKKKRDTFMAQRGTFAQSKESPFKQSKYLIPAVGCFNNY